MSVRRVAAEPKTELPANPTFIEFPKTDGTPSTWPVNTTQVVDEEGHVNFMAPLDDSHPHAIRWRVQAGSAVAIDLEMPEGPSYVLKSFPDGYRLHDHHKGRYQDPRHDLYLYGPVKKRFRSINEFIPHAIWLMKDPTQHSCRCKYCSGQKYQKEITASMSNILRSTPTQSPTPSRIKAFRERPSKTRDPLARVRDARHRESKVYAAVQRSLKPLKASASVLKQPMLVERSNDLRAIHPKTSMSLRRWFREGEVVWCALEPPIPVHNGDDISIQFWPGVIEEVILKTVPVPRDGHDTSTNSQHTSSLHASSSTSQFNHMQDIDGRGPVLEPNENPLPWTIRQSTKYKVQFLAISRSYLIPDDQVLPYQAHAPSDELIHVLSELPPESLQFDRDILHSFDPCPGPIPPAFKDAASPYATSLQIASMISSFWCLTDEFEMKYSVPSIPQPEPAAPPPSEATYLSLSAVIEAAGKHNSQFIGRSVPSPTPYYRALSGTNPNMSTAELQNASNRVLGVQVSPDASTQTRFQGLWWGTERIWVDDFIRLKVPRRGLAPIGAENILAPAGPGKTAHKIWAESGRDMEDIGAASRGVFMKLDGIFAVDTPKNDGTGGTKKGARACGMLYELVDEDWEDPADATVVHAGPSSSSHQAGPSSSASQSSAYATTATQQQLTAGIYPPPPTTNAQTANSGPVSPSLLPQSPVGYKLRPILSPGYEAVVELGLISGRYYPRILSHPRLRPSIEAAFARPTEHGGLIASNNLWALEGLAGGYHNSVDPRQYKRSRVSMMQDAHSEAFSQLQAYAEEKMTGVNGAAHGDDAMEIDELVE
ncbi:hypothetical protein B0H34DRAFT_858265 [Crassisporium funariophilum]|nr:hypothetical protein B0H34DRAFT_858265 [Crassisporium funariophilum]